MHGVVASEGPSGVMGSGVCRSRDPGWADPGCADPGWADPGWADSGCADPG